MDTKTKWNRKHNERLKDMALPLPNARLKCLSPYLKGGGEALDLACGLGGNSLFLAEMNYHVLAMDLSEVAVTYLQEQAREQKLSIQAVEKDLTDMENLHLKKDSFNLVVITYYLDRALFPIIKSTIRESGYFFMETFFLTSENDNRRVSDAFKLRHKELLTEFIDWKVIYFEENEQEGRQTIFCQKQTESIE